MVANNLLERIKVRKVSTYCRGGKKEFGGRKTPSTSIELDDATRRATPREFSFPSEHKKMG
jgi:hypothetical protein